jgi:hypothetical protein
MVVLEDTPSDIDISQSVDPLPISEVAAVRSTYYTLSPSLCVSTGTTGTRRGGLSVSADSVSADVT